MNRRKKTRNKLRYYKTTCSSTYAAFHLEVKHHEERQSS